MTIGGVRYSRVGNWRIVYKIDDSKGEIEVLAIRPRGKAYQCFITHLYNTSDIYYQC